MQRVNSDLRLNPHLHLIALDGVFVETRRRQSRLPPAPFALQLRRRGPLAHRPRATSSCSPQGGILGFVERRGVIERDVELRLIDDGFAEREPEVAALATAAVTGNPPAGPEHRQRPAIALPDRGERSVSGLSAREDGFSVHAATTAPADDHPSGCSEAAPGKSPTGEDARARETLCKYVLRPPLAQERVLQLENGMVRILLKRPFSDGTTAIDLDPLSLLCRLAASVPPPRTHRVHYSGVLAAAHTWRARVVPPPPPPPTENAATNDDAHVTPTRRPRRLRRLRVTRDPRRIARGTARGVSF